MPNKIVQILILLAVSVSLTGAEIAGTAIKIIDGDTVSVQEANGNIRRIRLYGIDALEKRQPYGLTAKLYLAIAISGKKVTVSSRGNDRYGRMIGEIIFEGKNINSELVRNGLAWHYRTYAPNDRILAENEATARAAKIGLWNDQQPIPPWDYRKGKR